MKTVAIIQARMGSTRLPGKVLRQLCGQSVLAHVVARVKSAQCLGGVMVATTTSSADDAVVAECHRLNIPFFRGSEENVLARYFGAAKLAGAETIVRVTSDCPLFDGTLLDEMLAAFDDAHVDYLSNTLKRTFPRGLDAEIFTFAALERANREAVKPPEREHVTPFLYQHPELFRLRSFEDETDLSAHRWTLDTPEDWQLIEALYQALYRPDRIFSTQDVLKLLKERPELAMLNAHVEQKTIHH